MASAALAQPIVNLAKQPARKYHLTSGTDEEIRRAYHLF